MNRNKWSATGPAAVVLIGLLGGLALPDLVLAGTGEVEVRRLEEVLPDGRSLKSSVAKAADAIEVIGNNFEVVQQDLARCLTDTRKRIDHAERRIGDIACRSESANAEARLFGEASGAMFAMADGLSEAAGRYRARAADLVADIQRARADAERLERQRLQATGKALRLRQEMGDTPRPEMLDTAGQLRWELEQINARIKDAAYTRLINDRNREALLQHADALDELWLGSREAGRTLQGNARNRERYLSRLEMGNASDVLRGELARVGPGLSAVFEGIGTLITSGALNLETAVEAASDATSLVDDMAHRFGADSDIMTWLNDLVAAETDAQTGQ